jgi:magnesium chelatase subunit D
MRPAQYPFAAVVGQPEMQLALMLAAVDWRLGVLLRGDKGSGKTTAARGLAALLPPPAPFINLPIGTTEDRLLGGLHLERALKGDPVLKPGLLVEAHGGVLYADEVNLLPAHLGDALLDTAASGVHVVEREGLSATHPAEFVLLGSMNPEEGSLRPQLLDRFALSVTVQATLDPAERRSVMERRIAFERDAKRFSESWSTEQAALRAIIAAARAALRDVECSVDMLTHIAEIVCGHGVKSLRADLAMARAAVAYAALNGDARVGSAHIETVTPLVLAHRVRERSRSTPPPEKSQGAPSATASSSTMGLGESPDRVFAPAEMSAPAIATKSNADPTRTGAPAKDESCCGPVTGSRLSNKPDELDLRATLSHALRETGSSRPRVSDLHDKIRTPKSGTRYLFVIDSSGSHAAQQRMRLVKGAISGLLTASMKRDDEAALILFRGTSAQVVLEPTGELPDALAALEYLPTGGRTPLAAGLDLARGYATPSTLLVLLTDGRANVALHGGDPWHEALEAARAIDCAALVVDTETEAQRLGQCVELADAMGGRHVSLDELQAMDSLPFDPGKLQRVGA